MRYSKKLAGAGMAVKKESSSRGVPVFSPSNVVFVFAGTKSGVLDWSKGAENLLGYKAEQVIGRPFQDLLCPESIDTFVQICAQLHSVGSAACVLPVLTPDKTKLAFQWRFSRVEITSEELTFSALGVPEKLSLSTVESLHFALEVVHPTAAVLIDEECRVIDANSSAISLFGKCLGSFAHEFFPSYEEWRTVLFKARHSLEKSDNFLVTTQLKVADGKAIPVAVSGCILRPLGCFLLIVRDLSPREELEREKQRLETRLRVMGHRLMQLEQEQRNRFATELHDELSQKLTLLRWKLGRIQLPAFPAEELQKACKEVTDMVDEIHQDLANLLTRLRNPQFEELSFREVLAERVEFFNKAFELPCSLSFAGEVPDLRGAKRHVALCVIQEAFLNAVRHSQASQVHISVERKPEELEISITDNGVGMTKRELRRALGSPGMWGMAIRAEAVDGSLEVTSQKGKGTRVTLHLPLGPGET